MKHVDVIIVGGGPAGMSAAIWCKRLGIQHLLIEKSNQFGGQLWNIHNEIIDYPGIQSSNGKDIQRIFSEHLITSGCSYLLNAEVLYINLFDQTLKIKNSEMIHYSYLIMATGAGQKLLGIPGEAEMYQRGEIYSATLDAARFINKPVAVIGGGDRAFEGAILLADAGARVYLIHRSKNFKARLQYLETALIKQNITIMTDTEVTRINAENSVQSIEWRHHGGGVGKLDVDAVFIRIGLKPNNDLIKDYVEMKDGIIVANKIGQTSNGSIYTAGDISTEPVHSSIAAAVGQGAMTAKHLAAKLTKLNENA